MAENTIKAQKQVWKSQSATDYNNITVQETYERCIISRPYLHTKENKLSVTIVNASYPHLSVTFRHKKEGEKKRS